MDINRILARLDAMDIPYERGSKTPGVSFEDGHFYEYKSLPLPSELLSDFDNCLPVLNVEERIHVTKCTPYIFSFGRVSDDFYSEIINVSDLGEAV